MVLVRFIWSRITPNSAHFEQAFSDDGGKTWEVNWITDQTRVSEDEFKTLAESTTPNLDPQSKDGQHDFDFEFGSWDAHLKRRLHPLTGLRRLGRIQRDLDRQKDMEWPRQFRRA